MLAWELTDDLVLSIYNIMLCNSLSVRLNFLLVVKDVQYSVHVYISTCMLSYI